MTASPDDTLRELDSVATALRSLGPAVVDDADLVDRAERGVAFAIAWLAPSREAAAPALEAAVAGAAPRHEAPLAADLLITVELMANGLRHALATDDRA